MVLVNIHRMGYMKLLRGHWAAKSHQKNSYVRDLRALQVTKKYD